MSYRSSNTSIDESMLIAFLAGDEKARDEFPRKTQKHIQKIARYLAPDLARRELLEDVVQQTWLLLLTKRKSSFDPERGSVEKYLRLIIRTAAQDIRAIYAPPGQRTRVYRNEDGGFVSRESPLSLDMPVSILGEDDELSLYDTIPDAHDWVAEFENMEYVDWAINVAWSTSPDFVAPALEYIYYEGSSHSDVAQILGVHPSTVIRRIENWRLEAMVPLQVAV